MKANRHCMAATASTVTYLVRPPGNLSDSNLLKTWDGSKDLGFSVWMDALWIGGWVSVDGPVCGLNNFSRLRQ